MWALIGSCECLWMMYCTSGRGFDTEGILGTDWVSLVSLHSVHTLVEGILPAQVPISMPVAQM